MTIHSSRPYDKYLLGLSLPYEPRCLVSTKTGLYIMSHAEMGLSLYARTAVDYLIFVVARPSPRKNGDPSRSVLHSSHD